jgi:hypothetical protein
MLDGAARVFWRRTAARERLRIAFPRAKRKRAIRIA